MKTLIGFSILLALSGGAWADSVTGKFVIGDKPLDLKHIAAFRVRDQRNARKFETYVMWTAAPVDQKAISSSRDPYSMAINDAAVKDADYVAFSVEADGKVTMNAHVAGTQYLDTSGTMMGQVGGLKASCRSNSAARVNCDVASLKPVKAMDGPTWEFAVSFDAPVLSKPAGAAIAAGGGDAGKALLALSAAHKAKNKTVLLAQLDAEEAAEYAADWRTPEENLKALVERFDWGLPKQPKVTGGETVDADTVLLEVEGVPYPEGKVLYQLEMHKVDGAWRYVSSTTLGLLK